MSDPDTNLLDPDMCCPKHGADFSRRHCEQYRAVSERRLTSLAQGHVDDIAMPDGMPRGPGRGGHSAVAKLQRQFQRPLNERM